MIVLKRGCANREGGEFPLEKAFEKNQEHTSNPIPRKKRTRRPERGEDLWTPGAKKLSRAMGGDYPPSSVRG